MVATDAYRYACCARKDRGATVCAGTSAPRKATDQRLLAALRDELGSRETIAAVRRHASAALAARTDGAEGRATRLAALEREIRHLVDAVARAGLSDALRARIGRASCRER